MVEKYGLEEKYWRQSFDLTLLLISNQFELLKSEFFTRTNYLESSWDGGLIYRSRLTIVLGWLSAFELYNRRKDKKYVFDKRVMDAIRIASKRTLGIGVSRLRRIL